MEHRLISVSLCEHELRSIGKQYHFEEAALPLLQEIYDYHMNACVVSAYFKQSHTAVHSKMVLMTLGKDIDDIQNHYMKEGKLSEAYMLECLSLEMLSKAYEEADKWLYETTGLWCGTYEFPGADYSIERIADIVDAFNQNEVIYNKAYTLVPKKSVVYTTKMQKNPPLIERRMSLCKNCNRDCCENKV